MAGHPGQRRCSMVTTMEIPAQRTPLEQAIFSNKVAKLREILVFGTLTNQQRAFRCANDGRTLLMLAADCNSTAALKALLEMNGGYIDWLNAQDHEGLTALMLACKHPSGLKHSSVRVLLEHRGVDVNCKDHHDGKTALMYAAERGYSEAARLLIARGADISAKDNNGMTALIYASLCGSVDTVKQLLPFLAQGDLQTKGEHGKTALIIAAAQGHRDVVKALLDYHPDSKTGASESNLAEEEADIIEDRDDSGMTALMHAANRGHLGVVKSLLKRGAHIMAEDRRHLTAIDYSRSNGHWLTTAKLGEAMVRANITTASLQE